MALNNSTFLVTGGSSGLGEATVKLLLEEGANVVNFDIHNGDFDIAKEKRLLVIQGDVSSESDVTNAVEQVRKTFGKLNGIINCAGIFTVRKPVYDFDKKEPHSLEEFEKIIKINTIGTFNVIRLFVALLAENVTNQDGEKGVIINTSSIAAYDWGSTTAAYSASKAAIVGMTMPLARDLAEQGIRVVTIAPGAFDTPLMHGVASDMEPTLRMTVYPKRLGIPIEFARFVKTIIETPMLNATTLRLDAGIRMA